MIQTLLIFLAFFAASHHTSEIQAPGRLTGQILDAVTRAALPGVRVSLAPLESGDTRAARAAAPNTITDAEGRFAFERVAPAAYRLSAERSPTVFDPDAARSVEITAGAVREVDLLIARAGRITGKVTGPGGEDCRVDAGEVMDVGKAVWPSSRIRVCSRADRRPTIANSSSTSCTG